MKSHSDFSLKHINSFNLDAVAPKIYFPSTLDELTQLTREIIKKNYILGEGSNSLFCEATTPNIIKPNFRGISITDDKTYFSVSAACSENWHEFVVYCVEKGIYGLENLALIPGSVGAAPVQNIGAYGVEVADFISSVSWFSFERRELCEMTYKECDFGYRESIFKNKLNGKGIITHVHFKFPQKWKPVLSYQGLQQLTEPVSAIDILKKVIEIRQLKLPEPSVLPNAGSFFKNPAVDKQVFNSIQEQYPHMPYYEQEDGKVKLAAGWLIEQAGLKGYRDMHVGVHIKQALVLVNYKGASGQDLVKLAKHVRQVVINKFNIKLIPEVRFIDSESEFNPVEAGYI